MLKRPKSSGIRPPQCCKDHHSARKVYLVAAFTLVLICALTGFTYFEHFRAGREPHDSVADRTLSTVTFFPYLHLNSQSTAGESSGELSVIAESGLDGASTAALDPFEVDSPGDSEGVDPKGCDAWSAELKVFMYDLPPEFHYGMIVGYEVEEGTIWPSNGSVVPEYPKGLYQQHSPEYWLTTDVLTSNLVSRKADCTAFRVDDWQDADVVFVPFFASLSYNRYGKATEQRGLSTEPGIKDENDALQAKLVAFLEEQPAWKASQGRNHVIVIHHPNSMQSMREHLRNALFVVSDFGRYGSEVANINKDVVAPYMHVIPTFEGDPSSFQTRPTLLFFQGAIVRKEGGKIRYALYELLKDEPGVHFTTGNTGLDGFQSAALGMQSSKFCLNMAGDTPSSNRLFDSIVSHCVPVIISDDLELPFEDDLDYSTFCIFLNSTEALQPGFVINLLRNVSSLEWTQLSQKLLLVQHHFEYQHPTLANDAVNMVWKAIARRLPAINFAINRHRRYSAKPSWHRHRKLQAIW